MVRGLKAEHEQRVRAVARHRERGLAGVEQAAVGGMQTRLRERAHALRAAQEAVEADTRRAAVQRARLHAHPCARDHTERALRAREHPIRAHARARAGQPPRLPAPRRGDRADRLHEILDVRPQRREVASRARRDPAPERGELERLREVAQRELVLAQLILERRPERAGLDARRTRDVVDLEHPIERAEVERDSAVVAGPDVGRDTADDGGAAAVGHGGHAFGRAPLEHAFHVLLAARQRHEVGRMLELSAKAPHDVRVGLAERMRGAGVDVVAADVGEGSRHRNPRRGQLERGERHRVLDAVERDLQLLGQTGRCCAHLLGGRLLVLATPAPVLAPCAAHGPRV